MELQRRAQSVDVRRKIFTDGQDPIKGVSGAAVDGAAAFVRTLKK